MNMFIEMKSFSHAMLLVNDLSAVSFRRFVVLERSSAPEFHILCIFLDVSFDFLIALLQTLLMTWDNSKKTSRTQNLMT